MLLHISDAQALLRGGAFLIDTRPTADFINGFITKSLHLPMGERFEEYATLMITPEDTVVVIAQPGQEEQVYGAMAKTGFINIKGIVAGGYDSLVASGMATDVLIAIDIDEFEIDYKFDEFYLIDIRNEVQYDLAHIEHAENIPLADLSTTITAMNNSSIYYLYGATAEEAIVAAAICKQYDIHLLRAVEASFDQIEQSNIPITHQKKVQADNSFSAN